MTKVRLFVVTVSCLALWSCGAKLAEGPPPTHAVFDRYGNEADALYCTALTHLGEGKLELAIGELSRAAALVPLNATVNGRLASVLLFKARALNEDDEKKMAVKDATRVLARLRDLDEDPALRVYKMCVELGAIQMELQQWAQAIVSFTWAHQANGSEIDPLLKIGSCRSALQEWEGAEAAYRQVLALDPNHDEARYDIAFSRWQRDDLKKALSELKGIIDKDADEVDRELQVRSLFLYGLIVETEGDLEEALRAYDRIVQGNRDHRQALRRLAGIAQEKGNWQEALTFHKRLVALDPGDQSARFGLAISYERSGLFNQSVLQFKAILKEPALLPEALNYLGYMYAENGIHLDEAEGYILRALDAEPYNGAYMDSLGWVYYQRGDYQDASETLETALYLLLDEGEDDPVVREHLGDTYAKLNRWDDALASWREAQSLDPKSERLAAKIKTKGLYPRF